MNLMPILTAVQYASEYRDYVWTLKEDIMVIVVFLAIELSIFAIAGVFCLVVHLLKKSNDFGDEDEMGIRKSMSGIDPNIGAGFGTDLSSGSLNCMKSFHYQEITKR